MDLPPFPPLTADTLQAIAAKHDLPAADPTPLPEVGLFNRLYALGDHALLRVPRLHPTFTGAARKEAVAVPAARQAGVRTPELLAFDDSLTLLPVPYTIYERVHALTFGLVDVRPAKLSGVWRDLGRDLSRLHGGVVRDRDTEGLELETLPDPRALAETLAQRGFFTVYEADWLGGWLEQLAPHVESAEPRFLHGDTQTTNILLTSDLAYEAVIDWGASGWGDPAYDFAGVPLSVVPALLTGYREMQPLSGDDTAEARILWRHFQIALFLLDRPPLPDKSWAERPLAALLETLHFLLQTTDERWRRLIF